jgi:hypothetical protein
MPVNLTPREVSSDLEGFNSVLIASCPVCPPMCLAMQKKEPFIEFFKHGTKTAAFEEYIQSIRDSLTQRGVRLILACDSGTESAKDALKDTNCQVIQSLDMDGVINATTSIHFPLTVVMERHTEPHHVGQAT